MPRPGLVKVKMSSPHPKRKNGGVFWVVLGLVLFFMSPFILMVATGQAKMETQEDFAKRKAAMEYLKTFRVVRVCPVAPEAFGQFVMLGSDGRYWLSSYAQPSAWRYVVPLGDVSPEQVC